MKNKLYELIYTSSACEGFSDNNLFEILTRSKLNNTELGITGMLISHKGSFVQILEGEKETVLHLYKKIKTDHRHKNVSIFYQGPIEQRSFENWSMAGKVLNDSEISQLIPEYEPLDEAHLAAHLINSSPNIGKELFIKLKEELSY